MQIFIYWKVTLHLSGVTAPTIRSTRNSDLSLQCILLHLVGFLLTLNYETRKRELKKNICSTLRIANALLWCIKNLVLNVDCIFTKKNLILCTYLAFHNPTNLVCLLLHFVNNDLKQQYGRMIQYIVWCMHVVILFPHTNTVDSFVCGVCVGCLYLLPAKLPKSVIFAHIVV